MKTLSLLLFLLLTFAALAQLSAGTLTVTGNFGTATATITVTDKPGGGITWSASHNGWSGDYSASAYIHQVSGDGSNTTINTIYSNSAAGGNSSSGEWSAAPGTWVRLFTHLQGPGETISQERGWFQLGAVSNDCQASVNVTNPYGVPTWFRVVHSIDGELGRVLLQPGQNWTTSWEVSCGGNFVLAYQPTGEETDDVWFVPENPEDPGEPSEDPSDWSPTGPPTNDQPPENPAPKPPAPPPPSEAGVPAPKKDKGWLPPWKPREDNEDMSNLLDRDTYREGVENIIGSLSDDGPVTVAEDENPTPTDERVVDAKETVVSFGAALISLREEVTDSLPGVTGSVSTSSTLSATLPAITLLGMTWPSQTWTYDFSDHSGAIGALRSLLIGVLGITYYFAFVRALRGSVPSMSRDAASALPESKIDPMTGRHLWDK